MRNRAGTSNINRRKMVRNVTSKEPSVSVPNRESNVTKVSTPSTPSTSRVISGSNKITSAGLVTASPQAIAAALNDGKKPVSTDLIGGKIKVDDEGRMAMSQVTGKNIGEEFIGGLITPTGQMVGVAKDVIYGVASEDQSSIESGLDLLINPLIKPFVDPSLRASGVIKDEWYWPEQLTADWKVLPKFMQKGQGSTDDGLQGLQRNLGNIGAIMQSEQAGQIAAAEWEVSKDRFAQAPAHYIGSAIGEVPYFVIGLGQIKAAGTITGKATAGLIRGGGTAATSKALVTGYKLERATDGLAKSSGKLNKGIQTATVTSKTVVPIQKDVTKAVNLLKKGYSIARNKNQKEFDANKLYMQSSKNTDPLLSGQLDVKQSQLKNAIARDDGLSIQLDKNFGPDVIKDINKTPVNTGQGYSALDKATKIDNFNALVQSDLLPAMKLYKNDYISAVTGAAKNSKIERIAQMVEGSPGNVSNKIDQFLNRPGRNRGDIDTPTLELADSTFKTNLEGRAVDGRYAGLMGNVKFNQDLWGNVVQTSLGITRANAKMSELTELISRAIPSVRVITKDDFLSGNNRLTERIGILEQENTKIQNAAPSNIQFGNLNFDMSSTKMGPFKPVETKPLTAAEKADRTRQAEAINSGYMREDAIEKTKLTEMEALGMITDFQKQSNMPYNQRVITPERAKEAIDMLPPSYWINRLDGKTSSPASILNMGQLGERRIRDLVNPPKRGDEADRRFIGPGRKDGPQSPEQWAADQEATFNEMWVPNKKNEMSGYSVFDDMTAPLNRVSNTGAVNKNNSRINKLQKDIDQFKSEHDVRMNRLVAEKKELQDVMSTGKYKAKKYDGTTSTIKADKTKMAESKSKLKGVNADIKRLIKDLKNNKGYHSNIAEIKSLKKEVVRSDKSGIDSLTQKPTKSWDLKLGDNDGPTNRWPRDFKNNDSMIMDKQFDNTLGIYTANEAKIKALKETRLTNQILNFKNLSYTMDSSKGIVNKKSPMAFDRNYSGNKKDPRPTKDHAFDYELLARLYPEEADAIIPARIVKGARPSVSGQKIHGLTMGSVGDDITTSSTWWLHQERRSVVKGMYPEATMSKNPRWYKKIGTRKVGPFRTLIPKKTEPMEDMISFYMPTDALQTSSGKLSGVTNIISIAKNENTAERQRLLQNTYYAEPFSGDAATAALFPGRALYQYKQIPQAQIKNTIEGVDGYKLETVTLNKNKLDTWDMKEQKYQPDIRPVGDILLKRAEVENKPNVVRMFREQEQSLITSQMGKDIGLMREEISKVGSSRKSVKNKETAIKEIEKKYDLMNVDYKERFDRLENWKASSPEDMATLNKLTQSKPVGDQRGTLLTMPVQVLKDEARALRAMNESDMIQNVKTDKKYFLSGNSMFEVLDSSFRPGMTTTSDEVVQQRKVLGYAKGPGMGEDASFEINVMDSTKTEPDYTGFGVDTQSKTSGKLGLAFIKHQPNKNALGLKIDKDGTTPNPYTGDNYGKIIQPDGTYKNLANAPSNQDIQITNRIFLNSEETWGADNIASLGGKPMLRKMDSKEVLQLKEGNTLGALTSKIQKDLDSIGQGTPETRILDPDGKTDSVTGAPLTVFAQKTTTQLLKENFGITINKFKIGKIESFANTRNNMKSMLMGDDFVRINSQGFEPDSSTFKDRTISTVERMPFGDSERITGFNTPFRRMWGSAMDPSITQPAIPGGVHVTPITDQMTVAHIIDETTSNRLNKFQGKTLQSNKQTNYELVYDQAVRSNVERSFKEQMVEALYVKVDGGKKPNKAQMDAYLKEDSAIYQTDIVERFSTKNNKLFRELSKRERDKISKDKAKKKSNKKDKIIDPTILFAELFKETGLHIDTRSPGRRLVDHVQSGMIRSEGEFSLGLDNNIMPDLQFNSLGDAYSKGNKIRTPNVITKLMRGYAKTRGGSKYRVTTEPSNPFAIGAMKSVLNAPELQIFIDNNKMLRNLRDRINPIGEDSFDRAGKSLITFENTPKTKGGVPEQWVYVDKPTISGGFIKDIPKDDQFIRKMDQEFIPYDKDNKDVIDEIARQQKANKDDDWQIPLWERSQQTTASSGDVMRTRPSPNQLAKKGRGGDTYNVSRQSASPENTRQAFEQEVYKVLELPKDFTTSLDRMELGKSIQETMKSSWNTLEVKQAKNRLKGDVGPVIKSFTDYIDSSKGMADMDTPNFKSRVNERERLVNVMQDVSDKKASQIGPQQKMFGFNEAELRTMAGNTQQPKSTTVGLGQQAFGFSPLAADIRNQEQSNRQQQYNEQSSNDESPFGSVMLDPYATQPNMAAADPGPNLFEQTIGDIQKTMGGINEGNAVISKGEKSEVKNYMLPKGIMSAMTISDSISSVADRGQLQNTIPSLLTGLKINTGQITDTDQGQTSILATAGGFGSMTSQMQKTIQAHAFDFISRPKPAMQVPIKRLITPKLPPNNVVPIMPIPLLPLPRNRYQKDSYKRKKRIKEKTWWQTPENWYEPYYWGGKNQTGAGYIKFKGKEPGKVKRYEKRHFGIGVNDAPFNVRSKWF